MKVWASARALLFAVFRRARLENDMDEELRAHIESRADDLERGGMTRGEAQRRARIEFGGGEKYKEECREAIGARFFDALIQDVRFGLRTLRKSPGFTLVAVLTIALGIGANTAIFGVVDWLILRPLPVKDPGQLAYLVVQHNDGGYQNGFSYPNLEDIRKETTPVFSYVAGVQPFQMDGLSVDGNTTPIWTNYVTGDFFEMLGIRPALGRFILPSEGKVAGADPVMVIGYSFWKTRFGGETDVIGKSVSINGHPVTIIGVAPLGFHGTLALLDTQGYLPLGMAATNLVNKSDLLVNRQDSVDLILIARLKPGIRLAGARPVLDIAAKRIAQEYPRIDDWKSMCAAAYLPYTMFGTPGGNMRVRAEADSPTIARQVQDAIGAADPDVSLTSTVPLESYLHRYDYAAPEFGLVAIGGFAGIALLLVAAGIFGVMAYTVSLRTQEVGLRMALGAQRSAILKLVLSRGTRLVVTGVAIGLCASCGLTRFLASQIWGISATDPWTFAGCALLCAVTGLAACFLPARRASSVDPLMALRHE